MENRVCPECGSNNVEPNNNATNYALEGIANMNEWECNDCGYIGLMPVEGDEENQSER